MSDIVNLSMNDKKAIKAVKRLKKILQEAQRRLR